MMDAMITLNDGPEILGKGKWEIKKSHDIIQIWQWSNYSSLIAFQLRHLNQNRGEIPVRHLIALYPSVPAAKSLWLAHDDSRIIHTFANSVTKEIAILPENNRPILAANDVLYRCERYYDLDITTHCVARLRYGQYYTELVGQITAEALNVEQFFELVKVVDNRMQILVAQGE